MRPYEPDLRRAAHRRGQRAERIAAWWLRLKGYRILERRFLVKGGEIDLICARGTTIVFVEVKRRDDLVDAMLAVDAAKRRRMIRAARAYRSRHHGGTTVSFRADAVLLASGRWPCHVVDAFSLGSE